MSRVRTTPRHPRSRSVKNGVCPGLAGAKRPPESPSRGASASPGKRAGACPDASVSVAAATSDALHLAHTAPPHAGSGEVGSFPAPPPEALPESGAEFVDQVAARKNLVAVSVGILNTEDVRIQEKHLDRLLELKYGKPTTAAALEPQPVVVTDLPRPDRGE